jgi:nicotinamide-nucleotide amidase
VSLVHPVTAAVIAVGEELLSGETTDTNGSWLGKKLASLGAPVRWRWVVGDNSEAIQAALSAALAVADLVIVTGGLGPTRDDLTRPAVADFLGLDLRPDPDIVDDLRERFRARGFSELPASNLAQADVPLGAEVLANALGSAPGLLMEHDGRSVALLPGVPREMRGIFEDVLGDVLRKRFRGRLVPLVHRTLYTTGILESVLGEHVEEVREGLPEKVELAFLPGLRGVAIRISTRSEVGRAETLLDEAEAVLDPIVAPFRIGIGKTDLVEAVAEVLASDSLTLAVAESCTGGLIAKRITDLPGSSTYFRGGVVAYADRVKSDLLGLDEVLLTENGAVSEAVAADMARGVADLLDTDVGLGITGIAGPGGGTLEKPVGTVWFAVAVAGHVCTSHRVFGGDREAVRERASQAALLLLYETVMDSA